MTTRIFINIFYLIFIVFQAAVLSARADNSAVVLIYHRFGEEKYPSTNIKLAQFEAHLQELKKAKYTFLPLEEIVNRLKDQRDLPDRTVAITVDDAYASFRDNGWPMLKAAGIPVTLFVSTGAIDNNHPNYMSWQDIRKLEAEGVVIGHHGKSHAHLVHAGLEAATRDITAASERFMAELGKVPGLFAYPYGEYEKALRDIVADLGFTGAFAQYSSVASYSSDPYALPRFPFNERYGDMSRLKLIANAQALPISDITPVEPKLVPERNPPLFGFTVDVPVSGLRNLACYPSHMGERADLLMLNGGNRVEIRFDKPFPKGRNRINCTLPGKGGRWYWFGRYFLVPGGKLD